MRFVPLNFIILCLLLLLGCSHTYTISPADELSISKPAELILQDNQKLKVYDLELRIDSLIARDAKSDDEVYLSRQDVISLRVNRPFRAILQGTALTTLLGAGVDFIILSQMDIPVDALGTIVGLIAGPIPSLLIGSKDHYTIEYSGKVKAIDSLSMAESQSDSQPTRPPEDVIQVLRMVGNEIDGAIYNNQLLIGGSPNSDALIALQYNRRVSSVSLGLLQNTGIEFYNYLSAGYSWGQGDGNRIVDDQWNGSRMNLSYGLDVSVLGSPIRSMNVFTELGMLRTSIKMIHSAAPRINWGVVGTAGLKANWNSFIFQTQLTYDTVFREVYPRFLLGMRF